jgi:hypothetical protein
MSGLYSKLANSTAGFAVCHTIMPLKVDDADFLLRSSMVSSSALENWVNISLYAIDCGLLLCRPWKLPRSPGQQDEPYCRSWPVLWYCCCHWQSRCLHRYLRYALVFYDLKIDLIILSAFPSMITSKLYMVRFPSLN